MNKAKTEKQHVKFNLKKFIELLVERFRESDISNSAIVITYFTLLSIFPLVIFLGNLLPLVNIDYSEPLSYVKAAIPSAVYSRILPILKSFLVNSSGGLLSFGAIATLWAGSKGINAVKRGINKAYGVMPAQNYLAARLLSMAMTLIYAFLLIVIIIIFGFGQQVLEFLAPIFRIPASVTNLFTTLKWPVTGVILLVTLMLLYYFFPNIKLKLRDVWPGVILTTFAWLGLSQGFSIYIRYFARSITSYGTIGAFLVVMIWLNVSALILLTGGVLNATLLEYYQGDLRESKGKVHDFIRKQYKVRNRKKQQNKLENES